MFGLCQIHAFIDYIRSKLSKEYFEILFKAVVFTILSGAALVGIILTITGTNPEISCLTIFKITFLSSYRQSFTLDWSILFFIGSIVR